MTKLFLTIMLLATIAGIVWVVRVGGADGSWIAPVVTGGIALGTAIYKKKLTGSFVSISTCCRGRNN